VNQKQEFLPFPMLDYKFMGRGEPTYKFMGSWFDFSLWRTFSHED